MLGGVYLGAGDHADDLLHPVSRVLTQPTLRPALSTMMR